MVASDPICFDKFATEYYSLEDDEFALAGLGKIIFYNKDKGVINKDKFELSVEFENAKKQNYSTFMLKEIFEEDRVLKNQVEML